MNCKRCKRELPDGAPYCCWCGAKQETTHHRRSNGEGYVYKRGQTWTLRLRTYQNDEYRCSTKGGFATKKAALEYIPTLRVKLFDRRDSIGFSALFEAVKRTVRYTELSEGKQKAWGYAYEKCKPLHGVKDVRELRYKDLAPLVEGLTFYPARDIKVLLGAMFDYAIKMEWAERDYSRELELPKCEEAEKIPFTDAELSQLATYAERDHDARCILLGCLTGFRPVELRTVTAEMIDLNNNWILGAGHKTEMGKTVPVILSEEAAAIAARIKSEVETGLIIRQGSKNGFEKMFDRVLSDAGIENADRHLKPNSMRHTFVTRLTRTGAAPAVLQKAARHTSYDTTLRYTHIPMDDVREAVNAVGNTRVTDNQIIQ